MAKDRQLSLDARLCRVDVWAVEHLLGRAETATNPQELTRKAASLYRGAFLDEREAELPQATALAETLRRRLLRQLVRVGRQCERANRQEAADWYEETLRVDPCAEDATYHRLERSADVVAAYRRCGTALAALRGLAPSAETQGLFRTLSAR